MAQGYTHSEAIQQLQQQQKSVRELAGNYSPISIDSLNQALQWADERESRGILKGDVIRDELFGYPAKLELIRWSRTKDILTRVSPGADEDPRFIEMLARQAASIEVILRQEHTDVLDKRIAKMCDNVLLATIPTLNPSAFAHRYKDYFNVFISAGLIDFLYQAAKAVVLSWRQNNPDGKAAVSFSSKPEDIDFVLEKNPYALELLQATIDAYMFDGIPRALGFSKSPPPKYHFPLKILTAFNERFIIAHEYGHTLFDQIDVDLPVLDAHDEEYSADSFAFDYIAASGWELDRLPPNFSLQGGFFVLTGLDVIRRTLDILKYGEIREDEGFMSHPPIAKRLEYLKHLYRTKVSDKDDENSIKPALNPGNTLEFLWGKLQNHLLEQFQADRKLHPMWE